MIASDDDKTGAAATRLDITPATLRRGTGTNGRTGGGVTFVSWDMRRLLTFFIREPAIAAKLKSLWATRLANRLDALQQPTLSSQPSPVSAAASSPPPPAGEGEGAGGVTWADYGYGSNFVYGR